MWQQKGARMPWNPHEMASALKERRERLALDQRELGTLVQAERSVISRREGKGGLTRIEDLWKTCQALAIDPGLVIPSILERATSIEEQLQAKFAVLKKDPEHIIVLKDPTSGLTDVLEKREERLQKKVARKPNELEGHKDKLEKAKEKLKEFRFTFERHCISREAARILTSELAKNTTSIRIGFNGGTTLLATAAFVREYSLLHLKDFPQIIVQSLEGTPSGKRKAVQHMSARTVCALMNHWMPGKHKRCDVEPRNAEGTCALSMIGIGALSGLYRDQVIGERNILINERKICGDALWTCLNVDGNKVDQIPTKPDSLSLLSLKGLAGRFLVIGIAAAENRANEVDKGIALRAHLAGGLISGVVTTEGVADIALKAHAFLKKNAADPQKLARLLEYFQLTPS